MAVQRFNTGNPIGSNSALDRSDNTKNFDQYVNGTGNTFQDRFGRSRVTLRGIESRASDFLSSSGYQPLGDYAPGIEITAHNQYVEYGGQPYVLKPSVPVPYTTSGAWTGDDFKLIGDDSLRQELSAEDGASLVRFRGRTVSDKLTEIVSVLDFGAKGDGITDDTAAFQACADHSDFGVIYVPKAEVFYRLTDTITWQGKFLSWVGEGKDKSVLVWESDCDGFRFGNESSSGSTAFEGLGLRTVVAAGSRAAIRGTFNSGIRRGIYMHRCEIRGEDVNANYWGVGVYTKNALLPVFEDLMFFGLSSTLASEMDVTEAAIKCEADTGVAIYKFDNVYALNYNRGIYFVGATNPCIEGVLIDRCNFVYVNIGIEADYRAAPYSPPQFVVRDSHIEATRYMVKLQNVAEITLGGNLFYAAPWENLQAQAVLLEGCSGGTISENKVEARPVQTVMEGFNLTDCESIRVINNRANVPGVMIVYEGSSTNCEEYGNRQGGSGQGFVDVSSGTNKGGRSITSPGYEWTSGGVLEQWGATSQITDSNGDLSVSFPVPFPVSLFVVTPSNGNAAAGEESAILVSRSLTGFTVRFPGAANSAREVQWQAKGV